MKGARLLAAGLLLAVLLGGYYYYENVWLTGKKAQADKAGALMVFDPEKVKRIRLIKPSAEDVELIHEDGIWKIVKPFPAEADQKVAGRMPQVAAGLKAERDIGAVKDPAEFGLDSPMTIEFFSGSGDMMAQVAMGARNELSGGVYVSINGVVSLITGISADDLAHSLFDLREKRLFQESAASLRAMEYSRKGMGKVRLEKSDDGKWLIVSPIQAPASTVAVTGLMNEFLEAKASGFHDEDVKDLALYGLATPEAEFVAYTAKDGAGKKVALGASAGEGGVFALTPDGKKVARVPADIMKNLPSSIMDIRLRELASFALEDVEGVAVVTPKETLEIRKKPSGKNAPELWDMVQPVASAADPVSVSSLLSAIHSIEAVGFPSAGEEAEAKTALDKPEVTVTLRMKKGLLALRFAKAKKEGWYWAGVDGKAQALFVAEADVKSLDKGVFFMRERRLFKMASADVTKILIERLGETFEVERKGDDYFVIRPDRLRLSATRWTEFVWSVLELRYSGVISEDRQKPDDPAFGKPSMAISVFGQGGRLLERVEIARAKDDDKWYKARAVNTPGLFDVDWFYVEDDVTLALEKVLGRNKEKDEQPALFRQ